MAQYDSIREDESLVPVNPVNGYDEARQEPAQGRNLNAQVQEYGQRLSNAAGIIRERAGEYIGQAGEKFKDLQNKDANQITEEAKDFARRKPGQALLIASAVGLALGFLLRGGRR